jgi:hypothetical protein
MDVSSTSRRAGRHGAALAWAVAWALAVTVAAAQEPPQEDPEVRAVVERFFAGLPEPPHGAAQVDLPGVPAEGGRLEWFMRPKLLRALG